MKQTIKEFKLWVACLLAGTLFLSAEIAVKANQTGLALSAAATGALVPLPEVIAHPAWTEPASPARDTGALVTELLVESVIQIESAGNPQTVGAAGERGLMQIMPATWQETTRDLYGRPVSFRLAFNPALNREVGTAYLATLHAFLLEHRARWRADERSLLLACYNAGPTRVLDAGFDVKRLPASTRDYVKRASTLHDALLQDHALKIETAAGSPQATYVVQARRQADS
jgi:soluble lytic murein transglycosylase-like protein